MDINDLKKRKKALKLTTQEVAYLAEIPYATVSKIFTGETKKPQYITIEKIDAALCKVEQEQRLAAYYDAMKEYYANHQNEEISSLDFEKLYRKQNHLSNAPIPFATSQEETNGNLALSPCRISVEQFLDLNIDKNMQLIDGKLVFANAPGYEHQALVDELGETIRSYFREKNGKCKVHSSGINLRLDEEDDSIFIPDIAVRCKIGKVAEYGILGAPEWIIEVTSPSTRHVDYRHKVYKYLEGGVKEYWVVDLQKRIVVTYLNDLPTITAVYQFSDQVPVFIYDNELKICLADILKNIQ